MSKILVALSGGLDSSIAAVLLHQQKYNAIGVHMVLPRAEDAPLPDETGRQDYLHAQSICHSLDIPFHVIDFKEAFRERVIDYLRSEYLKGRTPNPCMVCNREIKFGLLREFGREQGIRHIATGHYARIEESDPYGRFYLKKGVDQNKDQSYFLAMLKQEQLAEARFPLGGYTREDVHNLADKYRLKDRERTSSQDICFIASDYRNVFTEEQGQGPGFLPGEIRDSSGKVRGEHQGIAGYTIGQRKGIGAHSEPMYVTALEPETNTVIIGSDDELYTRTFTAEDVNWIMYKPFDRPFSCNVRIRYRHKESPAAVTPIDYNTLSITFDEPQRAVTPGQAAVLYEKEYVLAAGWITNMGMG